MPPRKMSRKQPSSTLSAKSKASKAARSEASTWNEDTEQWTTSPKEMDKKQERANRKRVQNRISQQCLREKQLAQQMQLETMKTVIKSSLSTDATSNAVSQRAALAQHLSLLDENRDLRDALLRMRKKLLSLSSATAAIANDKIFGQLLQKKPSQSGPTRDDIPTNIQAVEELESEDNVSQYGEVTAAPTQQGPFDLDGIMCSPANHERENQYLTTPSTSFTVHATAAPSQRQQDDFDAWSFLNTQGSGTGEKSLSDSAIATSSFIGENFTLADVGVLDWALLSHIPAHIVHPVEFFPDVVPRTFPPMEVSLGKIWMIEEASLLYLAQKLGISDGAGFLHVPQIERTRHNSLRARIASEKNCEELVCDVAKVALDMMVKLSGFSEYVYGVGANDAMEKVLRFRLSPTPDNRAAIPEPFSPTALQIMCTNYPISIDWLNWSSIRDQCLCKADSFDMAQLNADIVANTVVEIPECRAAINIHDTFFTRVCQNIPESGLVGLGLRTNFDEEVEMNHSGDATINWEPAYLPYHIDKKIGLLKEMRSLQFGSPTYPHIQPLSSKWCLDKVAMWKLSREFAAKYPLLDCTGVTSSYPMFGSRTIPE